MDSRLPGDHRNRTIAASMLAIAAMMPEMQVAREMGLIPRVKKPSSKTWTCKRCGKPFHPHRSPTICDDCHIKKWGP